MHPLTRLIYASKASFKRHRRDTGIDLEVGRILGQSRRNNPRLEIGGVLYYGDGHFFQVLEGPREAVQDLYRQIIEDPRHTSSTILSSEHIEQRLFDDWSMKYIPAERAIRSQLAAAGHPQFDPFAFDHAMIQHMVHLLHEGLNANPESGLASLVRGGWKRLWLRLRLGGGDAAR
ncbi:BLUF domain-containing protein [Aestuariirhabdus sp. LZHN29]|uniref:BLUF domain-containing protein n=1 Tax=Aestuariirhabdus sp. LZHN29 TaxID=3417462 RepID=UPI003CE817A9